MAIREATDPVEGRRRAALVGALVLGMTAGTVVQHAAPVLGPLLLPDLGISRAQLGALTSSFFLVGAVASPFAGHWADRVGGRRSLAATFLLGGVAMLAMGLAPGYPTLLVAIGIAGLAAATANPATNRLVLTSFPARRRGMVTGFKQSGVQLGAVAAGVLLPPLALTVGWRSALLLAGTVLLGGVPAALLIVPRITDRGTGGPRGRRPQLRSGTVRTLCWYAAAMGFGIAAVTTYLPVYAVERLGTSVTRAGLVAAVVGLLGVVARLGWGIAVDRIEAPMGVLPVLAAGALIGVALMVAAPVTGQGALWLGAAVFGATALGWNGVAMLVAMTSVDPVQAGQATGRVIRAFYLGLVSSPIPFGLLADRTGSYLGGWIGVAVAFLVALVVATRQAHARVAARERDTGAPG